MATELSPTKLAYFDDMWTLQSNSISLSLHQAEDGRRALILDSTIFHPQGGGQPADTGYISNPSSGFKFIVEDVRLKDGLVLHYGFFENSQDGPEPTLREGQEVSLHVDAQRRDLNSSHGSCSESSDSSESIILKKQELPDTQIARLLHMLLHSAGHLLDICMRNVGLTYLEPGKGYHFSYGPFVEYKGIIPQDQLQTKQKELEIEANTLISNGGKVSASVLPYDEAAKWCDGDLPSYISKSSTPRIVKLGENPGCPCGGTHVADIANIRSLKVTQIRTKKGFSKVFYNIGL